MKMVTVIIPVYNEEKNITVLYDQLNSVLSSLDESYEIIIIDDGSTDETVNKIRQTEDKNIKLIQFQRNFGKAVALSYGFSEAKGDIIITMDGDLQDDPKEIPRFIEELKKYDMVSGWKFERHDPLSKKIPSKFFNWLTTLLTSIKIHDFNCGYKAYRNYVVKDLNIYGELHRYIPALAHWKGYTVGEIKVEHRARIHGKSKYGPERIMKGFLDLITVKFLMSYSERPLHLFGGIGLIFAGTGLIICIYLFSLWIRGIKIGERPLLMLGILLVILSIQFISIGLIGELMTNARHNDKYVIKNEKDEKD